MLTMVVPTLKLHFLSEIILAGVTLGQVAVPLRLRNLDLVCGFLVQLHLAALVPRVEVVELARGASLMYTPQLMKRCVHVVALMRDVQKHTNKNVT